MNIRKKGAAIGFTATLLASLVAVIAAPVASASETTGSAGSVPRGGTSGVAATFTFTENSAACFSNPSGGNPQLQIIITDTLGNPTVHFTGAIAPQTHPGSLGGFSTAITGANSNQLDVNWSSSDTLNTELVIVGAKISADAGAATGAISATLAGSELGCILSATTTAVGTLASTLNAGADGAGAFNINKTSVCAFDETWPQGGSINANSGNLVFASNGETGVLDNVNPENAGAPEVEAASLTANVTGTHFLGETVTQTVNNCSTSIGSPGVVANTLTIYSESTPTSVLPGENNQFTDDVILGERDSTGTATADASTLTGTVTFSIPTAGVVFSAAPTVVLNQLSGGGICSLSIDRKSCSVTVGSNTGGGNAWVELENIAVDVDATAVLGSKIPINAATSPAVNVNVDPAQGNIVAVIGRVIVGTGAQPIIFIGFNDQASGMITLAESQAGYFTSGGGLNNTFGLCLETGESFTRAPWAVVTVGGGGLALLNPSTLLGTASQRGTLFVDSDGESCAYWTIYSNSTTGPGTIEIRGSDATDAAPLASGPNNGPRLSVPNWMVPGTTQSEIAVGQFDITQVPNVPCASSAGFINCDGAAMSGVSNAIRAFKNSVTVTAASAPFCALGSTDCLGGNILITETQNGQLKAGDLVMVRILPRSTTQRNDVLLLTGITNNLPIVTTNASSGLLASPVNVLCVPSAPLGINICLVTFQITQQSFGPALGQVTISNFHFSVAADASLGAVQAEVANSGVFGGILTLTPNGQPYDSIVTNATVGNAPPPPAATKSAASSALTKTQTASAFTVGTKLVHIAANSNNIVTIRIKVDPSLIGKSVIIQSATKTGGSWSAFTNLTSRVIGADGYAYFYASTHAAQWKSYRGMFAGNAQWAASTSQTVQVRWV